MTPSDDEIWAICSRIRLETADTGDEWNAIYRAAYAAGMEAAANIAMWYAMTADVIGDNVAAVTIDRAADAIRAANGREGKQ